MLINSINKCIQQSFLTTSLKNISSKSWAALAILAFSSFVIGRKYSCFFARKVVALWNKNESLTTTKVNQVASSVGLDKKPFEIILDQWTKEDPARIQAQKKILEFSSTYSEETHLSLVGLDLTALPNIFHLEPFLSKLKQLDLSKNSLTSLPESFSNLHTLTTLNLSKNSLTRLPESFSNLRALTTLNLSENSEPVFTV